VGEGKHAGMLASANVRCCVLTAKDGYKGNYDSIQASFAIVSSELRADFDVSTVPGTFNCMSPSVDLPQCDDLHKILSPSACI
jgi:hypothetical protein